MTYRLLLVTDEVIDHKRISSGYFIFNEKQLNKFKNYCYHVWTPILIFKRAKLKVSVFENGQFTGHLIIDKKTFFSEKKIFYPNKQELCFFEKKAFFFFWKKIFFLKMFFQNFQNFSTHKKLSQNFLNFFKKTKFIFIEGKKIFFSEKKV